MYFLAARGSLREQGAGQPLSLAASNVALSQLFGDGCKAQIDSAMATYLGYLVDGRPVEASEFIRAAKNLRLSRK
jgi:hypothetical protein